jgi:D-amino-acid dehydrogenase
MSTSARRVVVVGGGVIGLSSAYALNRIGWDVTIVDRDAIGSGASHGNCGYICPSHVLPLAEPGVLGKTIKALFAKNSPFSIKPRLDPALWSWLLNFARRCNERDMLAAAPGIQALLNSSFAEYEAMLERESLDCEWEHVGLLYVYQSKDRLDGFTKTDELLSRSFQMPAERLDPQGLAELEPALKDGLAGAWYYRCDAHLRPDKLVSSLRRLLESRGVSIREGCDVTGFVRGAKDARALATSAGEIPADAFVVATGATTPLLAKELGCRIPIQPGKGYSLTMAKPPTCPKIPMIFPETKVAITPFQSGYRIGSTMEFAGYDTSIKQPRLQILLDGAKAYLRDPYREPFEETWYGWRPMTYDSLPIIDRSPVMENVLIAAGHNMIGLSMAAGTGRLVSELVSGEAPHIDPTPYRVNRF